jgi:hypothetical protein
MSNKFNQIVDELMESYGHWRNPTKKGDELVIPRHELIDILKDRKLVVPSPCKYCNEGNPVWFDEFWMHTVDGSNFDCEAGYPYPRSKAEAIKLYLLKGNRIKRNE